MSVLVAFCGRFLGGVIESHEGGHFQARVEGMPAAYDKCNEEPRFSSLTYAAHWLRDQTRQRHNRMRDRQSLMVEAARAYQVEVEALGWHLRVKHSIAILARPTDVNEITGQSPSCARAGAVSITSSKTCEPSDAFPTSTKRWRALWRSLGPRNLTLRSRAKPLNALISRRSNI